MNSRLQEYEVPAGLCENILKQIRIAARRNARRNFFVSVFALITSFAVLAPASVWLYRDFSQSGFLQMLSLVFSDSGAVVNSWKDFTAFLLETMPFLSVFVCLAAVLAFLGSIRLTYKSYGTFLSV